ncbi:MAG: glycosyltransferase family 4 protein [Ignavibacteria bacterium]|nr:glycosyltransferase family 4 protein [Ignavibacteria bacterium]
MGKSNNIVLLFLKIPPPFGGGEIINQLIFNCLKEDNFRIFLIESSVKSNKSTQGRLSLCNLYWGFKFIKDSIHSIIGIRPYKIYISLPKDSLSFFRNSLTILFAKLLGITVYGDLAGTSFTFMDGNNVMMKIYGKYIFNKIDSIRILGDNVKNYIPYVKKDKLFSLSNGIGKNDFFTVDSKQLSRDTLNLIYVGSLEPSKGIKELFSAIKLCNDNNLKIKINILGEWINTSFKKEIMKFVEDNRLKDIIEFHGLLVDKSKWEVFIDSDVLIHPTKWDGQPVTILEAMSLGLGVITTNVGAIPDTIQNMHNGIILSDSNPMGIYNAVKNIYYDRELLQSFSANNINTFRNNLTHDIFIDKFRKWLLK